MCTIPEENVWYVNNLKQIIITIVILLISSIFYICVVINKQYKYTFISQEDNLDIEILLDEPHIYIDKAIELITKRLKNKCVNFNEDTMDVLIIDKNNSILENETYDIVKHYQPCGYMIRNTTTLTIKPIYRNDINRHVPGIDY